MRPLTLTQQELAALAAPVLERSGRLSFEARGGSMRPLIRSGDKLTLAPAHGEELCVGEVGLYRAPSGRLVVHRLVRRAGVGRDATLVFQGDARIDDPEEVAPSAVLARVVTLTRAGHTIRLDSVRSRLTVALWQAAAPIGAPALRLASAARHQIGARVRYLQSTPAYRRLGRRALADRVHVRLGTPADAGRWTRFHHERGLGSASQQVLTEGSTLWSRDTGFMMLATVGGHILGIADVSSFPDRGAHFPDWWLFGMWVSPLARGLGIGERIGRASLSHLERRGAERLHLQVFPHNRPALALYRKLGFEPASSPLQEAHRASASHLRDVLVMTRDLRD